jgi:hypothetical protein
MKIKPLQKFQSFYKKTISKSGSKIAFKLFEPHDKHGYQKEHIIELLNNAEDFLISEMGYTKYTETSGFRFLPEYTEFAKSYGPNLEDSAYIWKEVSGYAKKQVEELKSNEIRVFDIRNDEDFNFLQPLFREEILKIKSVLNQVRYSEKPFPVPPPFNKCLCFNCTLEKVVIPDLEFYSDIYGVLSKDKISKRIYINEIPAKYKSLFREDHYKSHVQRPDVLGHRLVEREDGLKIYHLNIKYKGKPKGYYLKETHSLFIMLYVKMFALFWEPLSPEEFGVKFSGQIRLRDQLKRCIYCRDYFLSRGQNPPKANGNYGKGEWVICDNVECGKKRNKAKKAQAIKST